MLTFFIGDLLPIIVIMLLGYFSGRRETFSEDQARAFNKLVLNYALPAALFVSITRANREMIFADTRLTLVSLVVIVGCFFFSWFGCYKFFKRTHAEAAVCALIAGSPTIGFLGFAVLDPIYGDSVSTGLVVAIISIIVNAITIPIGLYLLNPSSGADGKKNSNLSALISAAMYGVFLLIQTKTHQSLFVYEHEDDSDDDDPHHGKPSAHSSLWHAIWLIVHLIAVIAVTKMNASPLETLLDSMNAPVAFTGFLVALLILSPEGLGALKAVLNNQVQRAMNLFFGSVLATISLTVPVVTLIAFMTGNELQFALGAPEMVVMVASLVLCHISFSTGRTNVLNGAAHLALFAAYLMTIFA
ncbi:AEC family transporter [Escherichia coli]